LYSRFLNERVSLKEVREGFLSQSLRLVVFAGFAGLAVAQTPKLPTDIDPVSMSRFPIVERAAMNVQFAQFAIFNLRCRLETQR